MLPRSLSIWTELAAGPMPIGFGCCPMGGHGWGIVDQDQLVRAVEVALDLGVRLFDTADIYGLGGSETLLGRALRGRREQALIATKFGVRFENGRSFHDTSVAWMRQALDQSLQRLGVNHIDLYQMHYWDRKTPLEEIVDAFECLVEQGKIRSYGVTNYDPTDALFSKGSAGLSTYSYNYNLINREREHEILRIQQASHQVLLSWGSLGQGILSGKYRDKAILDSSDRRHREVYHNFHGERFVAIGGLLGKLQSVSAALDNATLVQLALRWIIDRLPRAVPLVGIKRPEQIVDAAGVSRLRLPPAILRQLDQLTAEFAEQSVLP